VPQNCDFLHFAFVGQQLYDDHTVGTRRWPVEGYSLKIKHSRKHFIPAIVYELCRWWYFNYGAYVAQFVFLLSGRESA
jgi:hypothetical protein